MESRPGIAFGFLTLLLISLVLILGLASISKALRSDGGHAQIERGMGDPIKAVLLLSYYVCGIIAAFTARRAARGLWMTLAYGLIGVVGVIDINAAYDKFGTAVLLGVISVFLLSIPTVLWISLLRQNE